MEDWQLDFEWLKVRHYIKDTFKKEALPDLNAVLYLVGIQELGRWKSKFTKEEKQDLMHIAACRLLATDGFYEFKGRDEDGWPHWEPVRPFKVKGVQDQESYLKLKIIEYFREALQPQKLN